MKIKSSSWVTAANKRLLYIHICHSALLGWFFLTPYGSSLIGFPFQRVCKFRQHPFQGSTGCWLPCKDRKSYTLESCVSYSYRKFLPLEHWHRWVFTFSSAFFGIATCEIYCRQFATSLLCDLSAEKKQKSVTINRKKYKHLDKYVGLIDNILPIIMEQKWHMAIDIDCF